MGYINTDIPELRGYDTGTVLGNLARIGERLDAEMGAAIAQIYELAEAIRKDAAGDLETVETILRALATEPSYESTPTDTMAWTADRAVIGRLSGHAGLCQRLILYRALAELESHAPPPHRTKGSTSIISLPTTVGGRIAYMKNAFADNAYLAFAHRLKSEGGGYTCRAATFHSFVDACEEVYNGLCDYCILPVENTLDGKLTGFFRLIVKYRLFITAVYDVENHTWSDKNATRFALLTRASDGPVLALPTTTRRPRQVELLHTTALSPSLTDLMVAATFCGLILRRMDTLPSPDSDTASLPVCGVWDINETTDMDMSVFLTYLALEASEDRVLGMY